MVLGPAQRPSDYTPTASVVASASAHGGNTRLTGLDRAMLGFLLLLIACNVGAALLAAGWETALATELLGAAYLLALAVQPAWRPLLTRLFLLGAVAGVCELFTDYAGEHVVRSLIYPAGAPMLWDSPIYMPLSWTLVLTQLGYLAWRLRDPVLRVPRWLAVAITGIAGAAIVPFYEEMAFFAGWWRYRPVRVLGHTPLYVLLFEGLIAAALPLLLGGLLSRSYRAVALVGLAVGVWMPCAALIAWLALGR
jgi:hypothetical protein